jgi:hypothetical protein
MDVSFSRLAVTALLSAGLAAPMVARSAAQSPPGFVDPALTLTCAEWKVRYEKLIEQHERAGGVSSTARDRATDLAYAGYARCVMGGKSRGADEAVATLKAIEDALGAGRSVAVAGPEAEREDRR